MIVVSFFAGCGGLDLGFEQAGFQVVWANEFESAVRDTYLRNHPDTEFVLADLNTPSTRKMCPTATASSVDLLASRGA